MGTEALSQSAIPSRKLWFGLAASAVAWVALGVSDVLITWASCVHDEQFGTPSVHPAGRLAYILVSLILFLTVLFAGTTSYRNWRALSASRDILDANATERREFMALLGVIVSATLGLGVLWLALPPFILQMCARAR